MLTFCHFCEIVGVFSFFFGRTVYPAPAKFLPHTHLLESPECFVVLSGDDFGSDQMRWFWNYARIFLGFIWVQNSFISADNWRLCQNYCIHGFSMGHKKNWVSKYFNPWIRDFQKFWFFFGLSQECVCGIGTIVVVCIVITVTVPTAVSFGPGSEQPRQTRTFLFCSVCLYKPNRKLNLLRQPTGSAHYAL